MDDRKNTVNGLLSTVCIAGVVARVESLRGRISAFEPRSPRGTPSKNDGAGVEGLFESLLVEAFEA
jgi:hypothetical protein